MISLFIIGVNIFTGKYCLIVQLSILLINFLVNCTFCYINKFPAHWDGCAKPSICLFLLDFVRVILYNNKVTNQTGGTIMLNSEKTMDKIVALCKGRGFVYAGSEIYGGLANTWDYGPLGAELKNNIKRAWWKKFVQENPRQS